MFFSGEFGERLGIEVTKRSYIADAFIAGSNGPSLSKELDGMFCYACPVDST